MKISFFETKDGMDKRAITGGIYQVELLKEGCEPICLYIGESVWIASRCGNHLYSLFKDSSYFGLKPEDLNNNNIELRFSVIDSIESQKSELGVGIYKREELEAIQKFKPLTQLQTSDKQIRDIEQKIKKVQDKMIENGFKYK